MIPGSKIKKIKIIAIIFILAFIDFLASISYVYSTSSPIDYLLNIINRSVTLFFATIFSIFILHYEYYRHHWIGLFLVIIGLLIIALKELTYILNSISMKNFSIFPIAIKIIVEYILYSVFIVVEKYCMDVKYISSYTLVGLEGISGLFLCFCLSITIIIFPNTLNLTMSYFFDFFSLIWTKDKSILIQYGLFIFSLASYNSFRVSTIQYFYPTYLGFSGILATFCIFIINCFIGYTFSSFFLQLGAYCIMIIGILIYLEILQLNFCKLGEYTSFSIASRSKSYYIKNVKGISLVFSEDDSQNNIDIQ